MKFERWIQCNDEVWSCNKVESSWSNANRIQTRADEECLDFFPKKAHLYVDRITGRRVPVSTETTVMPTVVHDPSNVRTGSVPGKVHVLVAQLMPVRRPLHSTRKLIKSYR